MNRLRAFGASAQGKAQVLAGQAKVLAEDGVATTKKAVTTAACERCNEQFLGLRLTACKVCSVAVCGKCSEKVNVPARLNAEHGPSLCCTSCADKCFEANTTQFRDALTESHAANVEAFLAGVDEFYPRPGQAEAKT